jgi:hypothetical protein
VSNPEKALSERIRELRRRHFGPRGKAEFARRLNLPLDEYERFERGTVPPGDVMLRMCELTGEDLQWLLTGVASRGIVVISGARGRHQTLLGRLAKTLDDKPQLAAPVEAFLDLLLGSERTQQQVAKALPVSQPRDLIPIFESDELPDELPEPDADPEGRFWLTLTRPDTELTDRQPAALAEPDAEGNGQSPRTVDIVSGRAADGRTRRFLRSSEVARCFPGVFGVRLADDTMEPMFKAGDAVLVAMGEQPKMGQPALCKFADEPTVRCRIWLGRREQKVYLGRLCDGEHEEVPFDQLRWSVEVLYRLSPAA